MYFFLRQDGVFIACVVCAPDAKHASKIEEWTNICQKLDEVYRRTDGRCVVGSSFSKGEHLFMIEWSDDYLRNYDDLQQDLEARKATSARQAS